jgi:hypothetical protein
MIFYCGTFPDAAKYRAVDFNIAYIVLTDETAKWICDLCDVMKRLVKI